MLLSGAINGIENDMPTSSLRGIRNEEIASGFEITGNCADVGEAMVSDRRKMTTCGARARPAPATIRISSASLRLRCHIGLIRRSAISQRIERELRDRLHGSLDEAADAAGIECHDIVVVSQVHGSLFRS